MTIISEEGTKFEIEREADRIRELLDLELPDDYFIDFEERKIYKKGWFLFLIPKPIVIASFRVDWNTKIIEVTFEDEDEYEFLYNCFTDGESKNKFHIRIKDKFSYY